MRKLSVEFRPSAAADLLTIFEYVLEAGGSAETARRYTQRLRDRCRRIGDAPLGGRARDDLYPGLRTVPFERAAVIAYIVQDGRVAVTNIFHGGRDYEALYRREPAPDERE